MIIKKAYKYRLYPNEEQRVLLAKTFGCVRFIWNKQVEAFESYDKESNPNPPIISKKDLEEDCPWLNEVSAAALQQKQRDFIEFKRQRFNKDRKTKIEDPVYKSRKSRQSFRLPNQKFKLSGNRIRLERIGWVKMVKDRDIPENARFLSCTVSMNKSGQYFVSILVEVETVYKRKTGLSVGVDLGVKELATLSDGTVFHNPKFLREKQARISRMQGILSRKKRGSKRRRRLQMRINRIYRDVRNERDWYTHNLTTYLVDNYDVICIEDLNVSGMMKNHRLAYSISDSCFATIRSQLEYKCAWYGKELVVIDRFYPSSKTCSNCGWKNNNLTLSDRVFKCDNCGAQIDRDLNAAINIKAVGVDAAQRTPDGSNPVVTSV